MVPQGFEQQKPCNCTKLNLTYLDGACFYLTNQVLLFCVSNNPADAMGGNPVIVGAILAGSPSVRVTCLATQFVSTSAKSGKCSP